MDITKIVGDFMKLTDSVEICYLRISEIISVSEVEYLDGDGGSKTLITLRNGTVFEVASSADKVIQYLSD
jgi:hypothetical protein